ncbi:hypothetical protein UB45_10170 [Terrabacter sp. 28]|nr:hypothetical protein UB45_10170 [Terrabacter sp. 28]
MDQTLRLARDRLPTVVLPSARQVQAAEAPMIIRVSRHAHGIRPRSARVHAPFHTSKTHRAPLSLTYV